MKTTARILVAALVLGCSTGLAQNTSGGLRGDPEAIKDAERMVEAMGGREIWSRLESLHFVHEWYPVYRLDTYVENEILDLTASRSRADRKSEIRHDIRAYSPQGKYWNLNNGAFAFGSDAVFAQSMKRAPFNFYRLVKAVAAGDTWYEVQYGEGDIPETRRLEFSGPDGEVGGWVILNKRYEPVVKATPEYRYTLGPLKKFGNLLVPAWGVYDNGMTRYEMISLTGDSHPPADSLFLPPGGH